MKNPAYDIVQKIGDIKTIEDADKFLSNNMDEEQFKKLNIIPNTEVRIKLANSIAICKPDSVFVNTGSKKDLEWIKNYSLEINAEKKLPMPGHTIHFDLKEEQGRIIDRTFYIIDEDEEVSSLAKKKLRGDALAEIKEKMSGIMKGKIMMIGFYMRGPIGSPVSDPAIEISSSPYVLHSANILYRCAYESFDREVKRLGYFFTNIHSEGTNRPEDLPNARVFMDRRDRTTFSIFCTYAGNTLLMKKGNHRFAVDKAVYEGDSAQLAEHMFITGISNRTGRVTWCVGAAPSGCGKTTTAMAGNLFIGDDLAQMWINEEDGTIRAINPECGIFGIVEDVNWDGDPMLMQILRKEGYEVIWTNVLIDENGVPQWTGNGEEPPPEKGFNSQGEWVKGMVDSNGKPIPISHPNSRCTIRSSDLANYSTDSENPAGVPIRVITYSGRDSDTMPPVWVGRTPSEGVVIGACIVSAATATEVGVSGVRRQPWANAPFIPGTLGDYMDSQFRFFSNPKIAKEQQPVIAGLNYFLTHSARGGDSKKLLGEKRDVKVWLGWLERLAHKEVFAIDSPIGYIPKYEDLKALFAEKIKKEYPKDLYIKQFSLYIDNIISRLELQKAAYEKEVRISPKFFEILEAQKKELLALKEKYGSVVSPENLLS